MKRFVRVFLACVVLSSGLLIATTGSPAAAFGTRNFSCGGGQNAQGNSAVTGGAYTVSTGCPFVRVRARFNDGTFGPYVSMSNGLVAHPGAGAGWIGSNHQARTAMTNYSQANT